MAIYELNGIRPKIHPSVFIASSAEIIGNVEIAEGASVWFGVLIRGDYDEAITIGAHSNIQDLSLLHADAGKQLTIGARVTIGHKVVAHGCTIGNDCLIGIGAIVLNLAVLGEGCLVGAGALVTEGKIFTPQQLIMGSPAKSVGPVSPQHIARMQRGTQLYVDNAQRFHNTLRKL